MSTPITVQCTHCSAKLKLKSAAAVGKKAKCPKCQQAFVVQAPAVKAAAVDDDPFGMNAGAFDDFGGGGDDFGGGDDWDTGGGGGEIPMAVASGTRSSTRSSKGAKGKSKKRKGKKGSSGGGWQKPAIIAGASVLGVAAIGAVVWAVMTFTGGNEEWLAWLPEESEVVVRVNVNEVWNSPNVAELRNYAPVQQQLAQLEQDLGISLSDIESVTIGGDGQFEFGERPVFSMVFRTTKPVSAESAMNFVAGAFGTQVESVEHSGSTYYRSVLPDRTAAAFCPDEKTLVVSEEATLTALIDAKGQCSAGGRFSGLEMDQDIFLAFAPKDVSVITAFSPEAMAADEDPYEAIACGVSLAGDVKCEMWVRCASWGQARAEALTTEEQLREQLGMAGMSADDPMIKPILDSVDASSSGSMYMVEATIPQATLDQGLAALQAQFAAQMIAGFNPMGGMDFFGGGAATEFDVPTADFGTPGFTDGSQFETNPYAAPPYAAGQPGGVTSPTQGDVNAGQGDYDIAGTSILDDVPLYPGATMVFAVTESGEALRQYNTPDSKEAVAEFYEQGLVQAGWTINEIIPQDDSPGAFGGIHIWAEKGDRRLRVLTWFNAQSGPHMNSTMFRLTAPLTTSQNGAPSDGAGGRPGMGGGVAPPGVPGVPGGGGGGPPGMGGGVAPPSTPGVPGVPGGGGGGPPGMGGGVLPPSAPGLPEGGAGGPPGMGGGVAPPSAPGLPEGGAGGPPGMGGGVLPPSAPGLPEGGGGGPPGMGGGVAPPSAPGLPEGGGGGPPGMGGGVAPPSAPGLPGGGGGGPPGMGGGVAPPSAPGVPGGGAGGPPGMGGVTPPGAPGVPGVPPGAGGGPPGMGGATPPSAPGGHGGGDGGGDGGGSPSAPGGHGGGDGGGASAPGGHGGGDGGGSPSAPGGHGGGDGGEAPSAPGGHGGGGGGEAPSAPGGHGGGDGGGASAPGGHGGGDGGGASAPGGHGGGGAPEMR